MTAPLLPNQVVTMMAARDVRVHHYLWHQVRNMWLAYDPSTQDQIRAIGWEPPRPAQRVQPDGSLRPILDNASGEDFLYMHRRMIASVNDVLREVGQADYPKINGWHPIPRPDDPDYPVPPAWDTGNPAFNDFLQRVKSPEFFGATFTSWERQYTDPDALRQWSLGHFGALLEYTIHNQMHMRWAVEPPAIRPDVDDTSPDDIDPRWDDPSYDWLGDTYSSHVNPIFWKLHGWVDDRIEDWRTANGIDRIEWTGTWEGNMPHGHEDDEPHALLAPEVASPSLSRQAQRSHSSDMAKLLSAVVSSGKFHHLEAPVEI